MDFKPNAMVLFLFFAGVFYAKDNLEVIKSTNSAPEHHAVNGFVNPNLNQRDRGFKDVVRWMRERGEHPTWRSSLGVIPVATPDRNLLFNPPDELVITWLGHSTLLIQLDGLNILTDPIFSERCSPLQFMGPRRYTPAPLKVDELPPIDFVLISHNHYDHLDGSTVSALGNNVHWLVPLGLDTWFHQRGIQEVTAMDWWDSVSWGSHTFVCTPAQHFSSRSFTDRNKTLWSSWTILGENQRVWFSGDTGYWNEIFQEIGERFGPFDLAAIPIGAYNPEWFMQPVHLIPEEAVQVYGELRARYALGIHWGTFILTDEPILEPPERLAKAALAAGLDPREFFTLLPGESRIIPAQTNH